MKKDPTRNTRAAKYRAAAKQAGGVRVDVQIGPEAAAVLARMRGSGMTVRQAVEAALFACSAPSMTMSNDEIAKLVCDVRDAAYAYRNSPFMREHIASIMVPVMRRLNPPAPAAPPASTPAR